MIGVLQLFACFAASSLTLLYTQRNVSSFIWLMSVGAAPSDAACGAVNGISV